MSIIFFFLGKENDLQEEEVNKSKEEENIQQKKVENPREPSKQHEEVNHILLNDRDKQQGSELSEKLQHDEQQNGQEMTQQQSQPVHQNRHDQFNKYSY